MTQKELLERLSRCRTFRGSLDPVLRLSERLGNPDRGIRYIHVAGTNGKGSVCAMLSSILRGAGYRTGTYISPYILEFRERIQTDGRMIPEEDLCRIGEKVLNAVGELEQEGVFVAEFDAVTMIAMLWYREQKCDVVVLETGLGGRFDSTNIIVPADTLLSVITSIGLDHTAVLGNTIEEIASEKAGIIKHGRPVVISESIPEEAKAVLRKEAEDMETGIRESEESKICLKRAAPDHLEIDTGCFAVSLPLPGLYQIKNLATVLAAVDGLREEGFSLTDEQIRQGLESVSFPARMELVGKDPYFWIDGAHNEEGAAALIDTIRAFSGNGKRICINGMMKDKSCEEVVSMLAPYFDEAVTVMPANPRSMDAQTLASLWEKCGIPVQTAADSAEAVRRAVELAGKDGSVVCCGSLYLCSGIRPDAYAYFTK